MKIFGFSRNGFLYIDNGNNLISQQTTSGQSDMMNNYCSLTEYNNFEEAMIDFSNKKILLAKKKLGNIDRQFKELEANLMGSEFEDDNYNNMF